MIEEGNSSCSTFTFLSFSFQQFYKEDDENEEMDILSQSAAAKAARFRRRNHSIMTDSGRALK